MMNNNRIGVYNLNNPFSRNMKKEEQVKTHNDIMKEMIMNALTEKLPRIKEESSRLVMGKLKPVMDRNRDMITELRKDSDEYDKELTDVTSHFSHIQLKKSMSEMDSCVKDIKSKLGEKKSFVTKINKPNSQTLEKEKGQADLLERIDSVNAQLMSNNQIYSNMEDSNPIFLNKIAELKSFIVQSIKRISEKFHLQMNEITSEDQILLEKLKESLRKINLIQEFLKNEESNNMMMESAEDFRIGSPLPVMNKNRLIISTMPSFFSKLNDY